MRILLAEDSYIHARMITAALEREGFEVVSVSEGGSALEVLKGTDPPAVAIVDWMMPVASGLEVCRAARSDPRLASTHLILLTSRDSKDDIVEGLNAGANDFITKPFDPRELVARVRVGVRLVQLERALSERLVDLQRALEEQSRAEAELRRAREREVAIGERIQRALLHGTPPRLGRFDSAALSTASQGIDGDFYDFFVHSGECIDVVVGDVMGKGVPAALLSAAAKAHLLRALASLADARRGVRPTPAEIMAVFSSYVGPQLSRLESFATACYARFDAAAGEARFVDAGHTGAIHLRRDRTVDIVMGGDLPLGVVDVQDFTEVVVPFAAGDLFAFYSDGVTDARNSAGEMFGIGRLLEVVAGGYGLAAGSLVARIHDEVVAFGEGIPLADDVTCVVVRIPPEAPAMGTVWTLDLASSLDDLARARSHIEDVCGRPPVSALGEAGTRELVLAVDEAFTNVISHAYRGRPDGAVTLQTDVTSEAMVVRLTHGGAGFDREAVPPPDFDGSRTGGFGIYIIEQCVDEVRYEQTQDGRQSIVLVKRFRT